MTFVAAIVLSLLIGVVLGMLGGGGAILALPMLVYVVKVEPKTAIAMSLFVVGSTSLLGVTVHARARRVRWKLGATFGAAAMTGAFAGARVAHFVPSSALLGAFAVVMLLTAAAMLKGRSQPGERRPLALTRVLLLGNAVGFVSGLVGAGGGFLIVPALTLFGGLAIAEAIGTSLFVIALQSFAGFAGHIGHVAIDWTLASLVTGAALAGTAAGASLGQRVSADALRRAFAWLVLAMGVFIIGKQIPAIAPAAVAVAALLAVHAGTRAVKTT
jgi:uncharacterized membrane protein YfcA